MTLVAVDIGGTHARFAVIEQGELRNPRKIRAVDHGSLAKALAAYGVTGGALLISAAAQPDEKGIWRFHNHNEWVIDREALQKEGWDVALLVNDFAASARGAVALSGDQLDVLRAGRVKADKPRAILGPGTGLGLAYMMPQGNGRWHVQETFGGHMTIASVTQEQRDILARLGAVVVPEDVASGRGLPGLYRAVCAGEGAAPFYKTAEDILAHAQDQHVCIALRLFHEFLGLFAQQALVTLDAFGGLYLDGGMMHRLREAGLFDLESFTRFLAPDVAPVVKAALEDVPVWLVNDPYVALRGLVAMAGEHA